MTGQDVVALDAWAEAIEQRAEALQISLGATQIDITDLLESRRDDSLEMPDLRSRAHDIEANVKLSKVQAMSKYGHGMALCQVDLTGDEDLIDEDGDTGMGDSTGVSVSLGGEISSGGKKSRESNIGGGKIAGRAIIT
ncbi:hypothetical protein Tco_0484092 [Tanacetum coccineum]